MKTNMLKIIIALGSAVIIIYGSGYLYRIHNYKKQVEEIKIENVDLKDIKDGKYNGECDADVVASEVEVTVKDHKIEEIDIIKHKTDKGKKAEVIINQVIKKQSIKVDTISGATNSSKIILKAIENALERGKC